MDDDSFGFGFGYGDNQYDNMMTDYDYYMNSGELSEWFDDEPEEEYYDDEFEE